MSRPAMEVADILRAQGDRFLELMRTKPRGSDPRRFRLGDEKEGAGAADAVIYLGAMGFE